MKKVNFEELNGWNLRNEGNQLKNELRRVCWGKRLKIAITNEIKRSTTTKSYKSNEKTLSEE